MTAMPPAAPPPSSGARAFVGRQRELAVLHQAWQDAARGQTRIVDVEGAPGFGKTALVRHFLGELRMAPSVFVSAEEIDAGVPWEILRQISRRWPVPAHQDGIGAVDDQTGIAVAGDRLARALQSLDSAFVLVVDNAHWGDPPSMDALRFACRRLVSARVLVLVLHQPVGATTDVAPRSVSPGLHDGWRAVFESPEGARIQLGGLTAAELLELAALSGHPGLNPAAAARLHAHTGGSPFHAELLLQQIPIREIALPHGPLRAPRQIGYAVVSRLASCAPATRDFVSAAAVLGHTFTIADARAICAVPDVAAAVTEAVDTGLVEEIPETLGRSLGFRSTIARASVYHDLSAAKRRTLHRAAVGLGGSASLWHRLEAADGTDPGLAADVARVAAGCQAREDLAGAAFYADRALELTPPGGPEHDARLFTAVEALLASGNAVAANRHAGLLAAARPGPWRDFAAGYQILLSGRFPEARKLFQSTCGMIQSGGPVEAGAPGDLEARAVTQLALLSLLDLAYDDMVAYGEAAVRAGTTNRTVAAFARFARALGLALSGRAAEALVDLADVDVPGAPSGLDGLAARGVLRLWTDDLSGAEQDLRGAVTRATQGESLRIAQALGYLGELRYRRGALGDAIQYCELAIGDAEQNGRVWDLALLHGLACFPTAARGDWAAADRHATESANWAELVGARTGRVYAAVGRGAIAQARGDARRTLAAADEMLKHYETREPGTHLFGPLRADALAQLGRVDDAERLLADYAKVAADLDRTSALMGVARVQGRIAAALGRHADAVEHVEHARELAEKVGLPIEAARAELLAAEWLHALRRYSDAAAHLDGALARLNLAGAGAYVAQAQVLNSRLQLPVGDRLAALRDLTDREHAVALQVGAGSTRREVAADLAISVKTVDNHLAKIFSKLDVRSQRELRQLIGNAS